MVLHLSRTTYRIGIQFAYRDEADRTRARQDWGRHKLTCHVGLRHIFGRSMNDDTCKVLVRASCVSSYGCTLTEQRECISLAMRVCACYAIRMQCMHGSIADHSTLDVHRRGPRRPVRRRHSEVELPATSLRFAEQIALAAWVLSFLRGRPLGIKYSRPMIQLPCIYKHNRIVSSAHQRTDPNNSTCPDVRRNERRSAVVHLYTVVLSKANARGRIHP